MDKNGPPGNKDLADAAREIGKALASAVPVVGGPLQVLFENVIGPSLEKRRQKWFEDLAQIVSDLQKEVADLTPDVLAGNPAFITTVLQTTQIAMRNHQDEKLAALRNAVFNSGRPGSPSDDDQLAFLRLIDALSPWQMRLLALLNDPADWMARNNVQNPGWGMGGVSMVVEHNFPELAGQRDLYTQMVRELQAAGLVPPGDFLFVTMTGSGMVAPRITPRGKAFISFVSRSH